MARLNKDSIQLFLEHNLDVSSRTIYFGYGIESEDEIDHVLAAGILKSLHVLSRTRPEEPITMLINCNGGDAQHGLAIIDVMSSMKAPITAIVQGHCHSMAAWVLQAADHRVMTLNSSLMIHNGESVKDKYNAELDRRCNKILLDRIHEKQPSYTEAKLNRILQTDYYIWPAEALEWGLIDEITE